jgi:membrane-bound lytic murein transglycosylase B
MIGLTLVCCCIISQLAFTDASGVDKPESFIDSLRYRLIEDGADADKVHALFNDSRFEVLPELLIKNIKQPDATAGYDRFVSSQSVSQAGAFLRKHRPIIENALHNCNVEPEIVTAVLQVESSLGKYKGKYPLFNTFASLTVLKSSYLEKFTPEFWDEVLSDVKPSAIKSEKKKTLRRMRRKSEWAYNELLILIKFASKTEMDPFLIKGSWAGAFGMPQFLPSSFIAYGKDGDLDGAVNLDEIEDAVASVAYYLKKNGYSPKELKKKRKAIWRYNHSEDYVDCIITLADRIAKWRSE